jgi:hypothetical protein
VQAAVRPQALARRHARQQTVQAVSSESNSADEHGPDDEGEERDETSALALGAAGALVYAFGLAVDSRILRLLGLGSAGAGAALYARERLEERDQRIDAAEDSIRSTLDELDPVARAQIIKDLAKDLGDG